MRARSTLVRLASASVLVAAFGTFGVCSYSPREAHAATEGGTGAFTFTTETCASSSSGTDDPVFLTIQAGGKSTQFELNNPGNDREPGQLDAYKFSWPASIGGIDTLEALRLDQQGGNAWCTASLRLAWDPPAQSTQSSGRAAASAVVIPPPPLDFSSTIWEYRATAPAVSRLDTLRHAASGQIWLSADADEAPASFVRFTDLTVVSPPPPETADRGYTLSFGLCSDATAGTSDKVTFVIEHDGLLERVAVPASSVDAPSEGFYVSLPDLSSVRTVTRVGVEKAGTNNLCIDKIRLTSPIPDTEYVWWSYTTKTWLTTGTYLVTPNYRYGCAAVGGTGRDGAAGCATRFQGLPLKYAQNTGTLNPNWYPDVIKCATGVTTTCGLGECRRTGEWSCSSGVVSNTCTPGASRPEIPRNTKDDNCNGTVDESIPEDAVTGTCTDGYDNDLDNTIDCADLSCNLDRACRADENAPCNSDYDCEKGLVCEPCSQSGAQICLRPQCINDVKDAGESKADYGGICPECASAVCAHACYVGESVLPPALASMPFSLAAFSRAGNATYEARPGVVATARPNELRWVTRDGKRLALFEGAGTNLLKESESWQLNPPWVPQAAPQLVTSADRGIAPDGKRTAEQIGFTNGLGRGAMQTVTLQGTRATFSTFAAGVPPTPGSSQAAARLFALGAGNVVLGTGDFSLRTEYLRFDLPFATTAGASASVLMSHMAGWPTAQTPASPSGDYYVWGAQLEEQPFPTSYIPTTSAGASRAPDNLRIQIEAVRSWFWTGKFQLDVAPLYSSEEMVAGFQYTVFSYGNGTDVALVRSSGVSRLRVRVANGVVHNRALAWPRGAILTLTFDNAGDKITVAGAGTGDGEQPAPGLDLTSTNTPELRIGGVPGGTSEAFAAISEPRQVTAASVACVPDPACSVCGDGIVNGGEVCDPSFTPYCSADCSSRSEPTECFSSESEAVCPVGTSCPNTPNGYAFGAHAARSFCVPTVPCLTAPSSACGDGEAARCGRCDPPKPSCTNKHCGDDMNDGAGGLCTGVCEPKERGCRTSSECTDGYACGKSAADLFDPTAPADANACWPISCEDVDPRRRDCETVSSPCGLCDPAVAATWFGGPLRNKGTIECPLGMVANEVGACIPLMTVLPIADLVGPANVGALPGRFDVTAAGAATYRVPVELPPGRGDLQPSLSIAYNSSQGNGVLGLGWGVDGLSAISVCNKSIASDPTQDPIEPALCLDGQRLIWVGYDLASDRTEWRTEIENFARIYSLGKFIVPTAGTVDITPAHFIVKHKNGVEMLYGLEEDSKLGGITNYRGRTLNDRGRTLSVRMWAISRLTDRAGNRITYLYSKAKSKIVGSPESDQELVPRWIGYNFADQTPTSLRAGAEIKFEYLGEGEKITAACRSNPDATGCSGYRSDSTFGFWAGSALTHEYRLGGISVYAVGTRIRRYSLSYRHASNGLSELSAITECAMDQDGEEVCRPDTEFVYEPAQGGVGVALRKWGTLTDQAYFWECRASRRCAGAFLSPKGGTAFDTASGVVNWNGDGYDDYFYLRVASRVLSLEIRDSRKPMSAPPLDAFELGTGWHGAPEVLDLDDDGYDDILIADGERNVIRRFSQGAELAPVESLPSLRKGALRFLDMDADGDKDALQCQVGEDGEPIANPSIKYFTNNYGRFSESGTYNTALRSAWCDDFAIVNAEDGREEFIWNSGGGQQLSKAWFDGQVFRVDPVDVAGYSPAWNYLEALDVNGDGLTDLVAHPRGKAYGDLCPDPNNDGECDEFLTTAYFNRGNGAAWLWGTRLGEAFGGAAFDIDHDGIVDWGGGPWRSYRGKRVVGPEVPEAPTGVGVSQLPLAPYPDVNGDGRVDFKACHRIRYDTGDYTYCDIYLAPSPHANLLKQVLRRETPYGVPDEIAVTYASGVAEGTYTPGGVDSLCDKPTGRGSSRCVKVLETPVVKSVVRSSFKQKPDPRAAREPLQTSRQNYTYEDARINSRGRGWIGFKKRTVESIDVGGVAYSVREEDYDLSMYLENNNRFHYPFAATPERVTVTTPISANKFLRDEPGSRVLGTITKQEVKYSWRGAPFVVESSKDRVLVESGAMVDHVHEERVFDSYGNLKTLATNWPLEPDLIDGTLLTYAYESDPSLVSKWQVDLVAESLTASFRPVAERNAAEQVSLVRYKYYGAGLLRQIHSGLTQGDEGPSEDRSLLTHFYLDSRNNVRMVTQSPGSASSTSPLRVWSFDYEERYGVNVVETQNPEGHVERTRFSMADGLLRSYTDPNQVVTTWKYDGFGRPVEENRVNEGIVTTMRYLPAGNLLAPSSPPAQNASVWATVSTRGALGSTLARDVAYDSQGRAVAERRSGFQAGSRVDQEYEYDRLGRLSKASRPHLAGDSSQGNITFGYDSFGRLIRTTTADSREMNIYYATSGSILPELGAFYGGVYDSRYREDARYYRFVETPRQVRVDAQVGDARGNTIRSQEGTSGALDFRYGANEFLISTTDAAGNVISRTPDKYGSVAAMMDPSTGAHTFTYNAWGEVLLDQHNTETHRYTYDLLGRVLTRENSDGVSTWVWDTVSPGWTGQARTRLGELMKVESPGGHVDEYSYEGAGGSVSAMFRSVANEGALTELVSSYRYDDLGRLSGVDYPGSTGLSVGYRYTGSGLLDSVIDEDAPEKVFWKLQDAYQGYMPRRVLLGDSTREELTFAPLSGRLTDSKTFAGNAAAPLQATTLHRDANGNVDAITRTGGGSTLVTGYEYDEQDRLTKVKRGTAANAPVLSTYTFKAGLGQLATKSGMGSYTYGEPSETNEFRPKTLPYAVRQIAAAGNVHNYHYDAFGRMDERSGPTVPGGAQKLRYNALGQLRAIEQGAVITAEFQYSAVGDRVLMKEASGTTHAYFGPMYEVAVASNGVTTETYRVIAGGQAIAEISVASDRQTGNPVYLHRDHLGSVDLVTDKPNGAAVRVVERRTYGAFGEFVPPAGGVSSTSVAYTGHRVESAAGGLTDMLGRFYDPNMGRFVSPDPFIPHPLAAKGYDRYAYVINNPLSRVDPTGFGDDVPPGTGPEPEDDGCANMMYSNGCGGPPVVVVVIDDDPPGEDDDGDEDEPWCIGGCPTGRGNTPKQETNDNPPVPATPNGRPAVGPSTGGSVRGPTARRGSPTGPGASTPLMGSDVVGENGVDRRVEPSALDLVIRTAERGLYGAADFSAGFGDTLSFGATNLVRRAAGLNGTVDSNSMTYTLGEVGGHATSVAMGLGAGLRAAGAAGRGIQFSHWIPDRVLKLTGSNLVKNTFGLSRLNGNYVTKVFHQLTDPKAYRFVHREVKAAMPILPAVARQILRVPFSLAGTAAGAAYGHASRAFNRYINGDDDVSD